MTRPRPKSVAVAVACAALLFGLPASAQLSSVSSNPDFVPTAPPVVAKGTTRAAPKALIAPPPPADHSFENGPPAASGWNETSASCGSLVTRILDTTQLSSFGFPAPQDGDYAVWLGGFCGIPVNNTLEQSMTIPGAAKSLHFWNMRYRPDADEPGAGSTFHVKIDGSTIWSMPLPQAADTYPNWVEQVVDISAFAGQTVTLLFGVDNPGSLTSNVLLDNIRFDDNRAAIAPVPTMETVGLGLLGALLGAGGWLRLRRRREH